MRYDFGVGNAREIVERVNERYRSARTYADEIAYRNVKTREGESSVSSGHARTVWAAPDRLLFELHDDATEFFDAKHLAIWTPAPGIVRSLFLGRVEESESIATALGVFRGVSHGLTGLVPRALVEGAFRASDRFELRSDAERFVLEIVIDAESRMTFFVDKDDYAVRRVVRWDLVRPVVSPAQLEMVDADIRDEVAVSVSKPFESEDTIDYTPSFDVPIDDAVFDLKVSSTPDRPAR